MLRLLEGPVLNFHRWNVHIDTWRLIFNLMVVLNQSAINKCPSFNSVFRHREVRLVIRIGTQIDRRINRLLRNS